METEFIYWRHPTLPGIKVEEVCGGEDKQGRVWLEMARQVYCENGREGYRDIGHFHNGAPFLFGEQGRISITHTDGLLAVATLPPTPEVELGVFSERAAMGIDAERCDRDQVLKVREKFLSDEEMKVVPTDDVLENIIAWTCKEALYKASMTEGLDLKENIRIVKFPHLAPATTVYDKKEFPEVIYGEALLRIPVAVGIKEVDMRLYSYETEGCVVTLAFSPRCAKFGKSE